MEGCKRNKGQRARGNTQKRKVNGEMADVTLRKTVYVTWKREMGRDRRKELRAKAIQKAKIEEIHKGRGGGPLFSLISILRLSIPSLRLPLPAFYFFSPPIPTPGEQQKRK